MTHGDIIRHEHGANGLRGRSAHVKVLKNVVGRGKKKKMARGG
jgi:hypothetical protein